MKNAYWDANRFKTVLLLQVFICLFLFVSCVFDEVCFCDVFISFNPYPAPWEGRVLVYFHIYLFTITLTDGLPCLIPDVE